MNHQTHRKIDVTTMMVGIICGETILHRDPQSGKIGAHVEISFSKLESVLISSLQKMRSDITQSDVRRSVLSFRKTFRSGVTIEDMITFVIDAVLFDKDF